MRANYFASSSIVDALRCPSGLAYGDDYYKNQTEGTPATTTIGSGLLRG